MQDLTHGEKLDLYREALAETADDQERRALFLHIACLLAEARTLVHPADFPEQI